MTEQPLVTALLKLLRAELRDYKIIKHADRWTKGIPDFSATGDGITSWWEVKHTTDHSIKHHKDFGIQWETMKALERAGTAYYVVYSNRGLPRVEIARPSKVQQDGSYEAMNYKVGYEHFHVLDFIRRTHGDHRPT